MEGVLKTCVKFKENTYGGVSFEYCCSAHYCNFVKRETLTNKLSCKFCATFKNAFKEYLRVTASSPSKGFVILQILANFNKSLLVSTL